MSAFMCSAGAISRIANAVSEYVKEMQYKYPKDARLREVPEAICSILKEDSWCRTYYLDKTDVFRVLADMNKEALKERYEDGAPEMIPEDFEYEASSHEVDHALIKCFDCYLYQCAEGRVYKSPLYNWLEKLEDTLCRDIVCCDPKYEEASWG